MLRVNNQKVTGVDYSKVNYSVEPLNFEYLCNHQPESHRVFSIGFGMGKLTTLMFLFIYFIYLFILFFLALGDLFVLPRGFQGYT